jgi:hypothetical protein
MLIISQVLIPKMAEFFCYFGAPLMLAVISIKISKYETDMEDCGIFYFKLTGKYQIICFVCSIVLSHTGKFSAFWSLLHWMNVMIVKLID